MRELTVLILTIVTALVLACLAERPND